MILLSALLVGLILASGIFGYMLGRCSNITPKIESRPYRYRKQYKH